MILTSSKKQPFTVKQFRYNDIIDFKNWWLDFYKESCSTLNRSVGSHRQTFAVSNFKQVLYESSSPRYVKTWGNINGLHSDTFKLLKKHKKAHLSPIMERTKILPINEKKISDIKKVMPHIRKVKRLSNSSMQLVFRNAGNYQSLGHKCGVTFRRKFKCKKGLHIA
nr:unnamed protein product [Callosobruchus chinensis]